MTTREVVLTGIGLVSPLGSDVKLFWERIKAGRSGIRRIQNFDAKDLDSQIAGEVVEFDVSKFLSVKEQRRLDPFCHYAIAAAKLCVADGGLDMSREDANRVGVLVGSGIGGIHTLQTQYAVMVEKGPKRCSPFMIPQMIVNMASGHIAIECGMKGPNFAVVSACATALHSIGEAFRMIQLGYADAMLAGGAEAAACTMGIAGFAAMRALSCRNDQPEKASRPFDKDRDGFVMADGAAVVLLESLEHARKRGASIYCEVAGTASTCDAYHMTAPAEGGEGAANAMKLAMADAGLAPDTVDYINAHGTSTQLNDKAESMAIKTAFGPEHSRRVMVSSSKSMTGHLLGAAGGIETAVCALALRDGIVPPTINYETPDPACDLDYVPNVAREKKIRACLNNSLGFGGHNACLALKAMK